MYKEWNANTTKSVKMLHVKFAKLLGKNQVKLRLRYGENLMEVVMEKINGMIMSTLWFHECWM